VELPESAGRSHIPSKKLLTGEFGAGNLQEFQINEHRKMDFVKKDTK